MKFRLRNKRNRNEALRQYRRAHPEITLQEIGEMYNISKQRVCQILAKTNGKKPD